MTRNKQLPWILSGFLIFTVINLAGMARAGDPFKITNPIRPKYESLYFGKVLPSGWLKVQITQNLAGFTGHLDSLVPALILEDDIYGRDRLTKNIRAKDVGALTENGQLQPQFLWWNSETQSNWRDGFIRSAILADDSASLSRSRDYVRQILKTQDADGYLGIYDRELRYNFDNENGELWAKASLFRGLLAWYEFTGDDTILKAVVRATEDVMNHYPPDTSHPFRSVNPDAGGLTHGLTFTDILEELYRITAEERYMRYALFLYRDFSSNPLNEDAQYWKLIDENIPLKGHGVHTYEHLRPLAAAWFAAGNPSLEMATKDFLKKIETETCPSGGPAGDEWIDGRKADATLRGYEYCSLHELMHSYASLLKKTGDPLFAEKMERIFFNAAQGARHPEESSIAYLKSDNSYVMTGGLNGDTTHRIQTRYKYSPVHQDVAVCCVPNAGRIAPYYVQHMWMKDKEALVAMLLGPCNVNTRMGENTVRIEEETLYPRDFSILFRVSCESPESFTLKIRKPVWATGVVCDLPYHLTDEFVVIRKVWQIQESFRITFETKPVVSQDQQGEYYFSLGPLVMAHPIAGEPLSVKSYPLKGFRDLHYTPDQYIVYQYLSDGKIIQSKDCSMTVEVFNPIKNVFA